MNAIITAATGYTEEHLRIFLWSVEKSCQDTLVFLIVYRRDREAIEKLRNKYPFIRPVYISASIRRQFLRLADDRTRPYFKWLANQLSKKKYSSTFPLVRLLGQLATRIIHERFFIALQILKSHRNNFSNVLISDCRDVVIQKDPFSLLDGRLICGLEPEVIANENYTSAWIETVYGRDYLNKIQNKSVVCAGVTLGTAEKIENYLTEICNEMWKYLPQMIFKEWGYDQATHIYLIYEQRINPELTSNHQGIITTISLEQPGKFSLDCAQGLVKVYDKYPAIIHQYDRHPELLRFFENLFTNSTTNVFKA